MIVAVRLVLVGRGFRSACRAGRAAIWRRSDCQLQQDINDDSNNNALLKACMKTCHQARWFVRTELGGCHALEFKSGGFRSRRRVSRAKTAWHGESNNNRQATTNMPLRDSSSHHSADSDLESKQLPSSFTVRRRGPPVKRRFGALTPRQTELRTLAGTSK